MLAATPAILPTRIAALSTGISSLIKFIFVMVITRVSWYLLAGMKNARCAKWTLQHVHANWGLTLGTQVPWGERKIGSRIWWIINRVFGLVLRGYVCSAIGLMLCCRYAARCAHNPFDSAFEDICTNPWRKRNWSIEADSFLCDVWLKPLCALCMIWYRWSFQMLFPW